MKILVFQHVDVEHPGVFRDFWSEGGHEWTTVELDVGEKIPAFGAFHLLVAMGGPMDVWQEDIHPWLVLEKAAIRHWVRDLGKPFLGVCLGHQLLADALGGSVGLMARPEVGVTTIDLTPAGLSDPILSGFPPNVECLQWHGAEITKLPEGGEVLATNAACRVQAMRWGKHAYGFQYHCEITPSTVSDWAKIPEYKASLERALGTEKAERFGDDVQLKIPTFRAAAQKLNRNFTEILTRGTEFVRM